MPFNVVINASNLVFQLPLPRVSFYAFGSKFAFFFLLCFQLVIDKNKPVVRFGMMHLTATNVCVVIVTIITETAEDYRFEAFSSLNVTKGIIKIL